ncbi:MAG: fibronectin type III domain-containing protein, partial [Acidobacteriota bacterium]
MLTIYHRSGTGAGLRPYVAHTMFAVIAVAACALGVSGLGYAYTPQSGTVSAGSASGTAGNSVDLTINLSPGSGNVCSLQFDLQFSSSLNYVTTATGSAAAAAQKTVLGNSLSGGVRVLVFMNRNIIGTGPLAVVTLAIASGTPPGAIPVAVTNITASDPDGMSVPVSGVGGSVTVLSPPDTTPPVISGVGSSGISSSSATISWTTNEASDSQIDFGPTTSYGSSTTLDANMVTSHSQTLTGLVAGATYHYQVKSRDAAGNLATLGDFTFTTVDTTPPTISAVASSNITGTSATITWTTNEASNSQVEFGTTVAYGSATALDAGMVTSHTMSLTGLSSGTTYHFRVKSRDASGNLATSGDFTFTTVDTTPPAISAVASSSVTGTSATISWTTDKAANSQVQYGTTSAYGNSTAIDTNMVNAHSQA